MDLPVAVSTPWAGGADPVLFEGAHENARLVRVVDCRPAAIEWRWQGEDGVDRGLVLPVGWALRWAAGLLARAQVTGVIYWRWRAQGATWRAQLGRAHALQLAEDLIRGAWLRLEG